MPKQEAHNKSTLNKITQSPGFTLFMLTLAGQFTREHLIEALEPTGLHLRHFGILICLQCLGPLSQSTAAQRLAIDKSTAVAVIDDLEKWGYVKRKRNPKDRRIYNLTVTEAGIKKSQAAASINDQLVEDILGPMNEEDLKNFRKPLSYVMKNHGAF